MLKEIGNFIKTLVRPTVAWSGILAVIIFTGMRVVAALEVQNFDEAGKAVADFLPIALAIGLYYFKAVDEKRNSPK